MTRLLIAMLALTLTAATNPGRAGEPFAFDPFYSPATQVAPQVAARPVVPPPAPAIQPAPRPVYQPLPLTRLQPARRVLLRPAGRVLRCLPGGL